MFIDLILFILFAGAPYYVYFEKTKKLEKEKIFLLASFLVLCGIVLSYLFPHETSMPFVVASFFASLYSLYRAEHTRNLYKLGYYILFFNAPVLLMFGHKESTLYALSMLLSLFGLYFIAKYYERNYGSANYQSVSGLTLVTPYAALFLTIYLTTLALYPPFPNALLFLKGILSSDTHVMWYVIIAVIFFGNFLIAMRVMAKTVFGKPNENVHYVELTLKEKRFHLGIVIILLLLSIVGLKELVA